MADDFSSLIRNIDAKVSTIEREIKAARGEIDSARQEVGKVLSAQQRLNAEMGAVQQKIAQVQAGQDALRQDLNTKLAALQNDLSATMKSLQSQQSQLDSLVAAQKEDAARRRLEQERGQFVLALGGLLGQIKDGAVRFVFATYAIEACASRQIASDQFQSVTDQKTVADQLAALKAAEENASDADRAEANRFLEIRHLMQEVPAFRGSYLGAEASADRAHQSMSGELQRRESDIAALEAPEAPAATNRRHLRRTVLAVAGGVLLVPGVVLSVGQTPAPGVGIAVAGLCLLGLSWLQTDAHRRRKLESLKARQQRGQAQLVQLDTDTKRNELDAAASVEAFRRRLAAVTALSMPASQDVGAALQGLADAASAAEAAWRSRHAEVKLVG